MHLSRLQGVIMEPLVRDRFAFSLGRLDMETKQKIPAQNSHTS